jgi:hypothetical protein
VRVSATVPMDAILYRCMDSEMSGAHSEGGIFKKGGIYLLPAFSGFGESYVSQ